MARGFQLDRSVIQKIEGRISETRERLEQGGSAAVVQRPLDFVADAAGASRSTIQRWLRDARQAERGTDQRARAQLLRDFGASFDVLCRVSVAPVERTLIEIASDAKHPRCVDAAKYMHGRLDPIGEGQQTEELAPEREPMIADLPQAVFDALTDEELDAIEQLQIEREGIERRLVGVLRGAAERAGAGRDAVERFATS